MVTTTHQQSLEVSKPPKVMFTRARSRKKSNHTNIYQETWPARVNVSSQDQDRLLGRLQTVSYLDSILPEMILEPRK